MLTYQAIEKSWRSLRVNSEFSSLSEVIRFADVVRMFTFGDTNHPEMSKIR